MDGFLGKALYRVYTSPVGWYLNKFLLNPTGPEPHSLVDPERNVLDADGVQVIPLPVGQDNYAYAVLDARHNELALVDPSDAAHVLAWIDEALGRPAPPKLVAILTTHKHHDHSGGNVEIVARFPNCAVYGGRGEWVPAATHELGGTVDAPDEARIGTRMRVRSVVTPCHTRASLVYVLDVPTSSTFPPCLFSGDTVFRGGVGKFFEGSADEMQAVVDALRAAPASLLPPATALLWPGHEYALPNLEFAALVDPTNPAVLDDLREVRTLRAAKRATVPSLFAREWATNPFLRTREPSVVEYCRAAHARMPDAVPGETLSPGAQVMAMLRGVKTAGVAAEPEPVATKVE
ncbi:Cytoplasmic glyoxalase II [Blastocladiella emersonii ATCC 22665]|nr:Cytoplasmic glyoxalase II [Blastocladiella emersonii ATCC 22665]